MAGIRESVVEVGQIVTPDRYSTLAREALLYDEVRSAGGTITGDYSITDNDHALLVTAGGSTLTLPNAVFVPNREYQIKNANAGSDITIDSAGGTIDGSSTYDVGNNEAVTVRSDGSDWWLIAGLGTGAGGGSTRFLGFFTTGTKPAAAAGNNGYWLIVRDPASAASEEICLQNSDGTYGWVVRGVAQY